VERILLSASFDVAFTMIAIEMWGQPPPPAVRRAKPSNLVWSGRPRPLPLTLLLTLPLTLFLILPERMAPHHRQHNRERTALNRRVKPP
jgi:hypothetical protein